MKDKLKVGKLTELRTLLSAIPSKPEIVATFLASLELGRLKKMKLFQEIAYGPIYVELLEAIKEMDTQLATGFDAEDAQKPGNLFDKVNEQIKAEKDQASGGAEPLQAAGTETLAAAERPQIDLSDESLFEKKETPSADQALQAQTAELAALTESGIANASALQNNN